MLSLSCIKDHLIFLLTLLIRLEANNTILILPLRQLSAERVRNLFQATQLVRDRLGIRITER